MDQSQQQMAHHVGVLSKYLSFQQEMLEETRDLCTKITNTTASIPQAPAEDANSPASGNVFTSIFKFGK
jgi:hypothetical protein